MANKRINNSAGTKIRHYVFAMLRKHSETSVKLPSSYELAEMFGTTRRVARYELERLISQEALISRPRIGTFTNPRKNYINITPIQKKMPLIGIIDGDGQRFCYGCAENLIYSNMGLALAKRKCYVHHIAFSCTDDESRIKELKTLGLDGILWHIPGACGFPSEDFLNKVDEEGIPVVAIAHSAINCCHSIVLSTLDAEEKLSRIFKEEQRNNILVLTNLTLELTIALGIMRRMGLSDNSLQVFDQADSFQDKIAKLQEQLKYGYRPDLIICDPMFAETVPEILSAAGIDIDQQCRLVACNELNIEEEFRGYIIKPDAAEIAETAVDTVLAIRNGRKQGNTIKEISCMLKEISH